MFITKIKEKFKENEPIFTSEILELFSEYSRAYVFRIIEKLVEKEELLKYSRGIYFIPTRSIVGVSTITLEHIINKKYVKNNNEYFGVYSGLVLQNIFSISTQMPNTIEVVSNNESMRCRTMQIDGRTVRLKKSRTTINNENVSVYILLQLFTDLDEDSKINNWAKQKIKQYIKDSNITMNDIITTSKYFPAQTLKKIMMSGVLDDFV